MTVRIVTDSASDLPVEMAEALEIVVVPLHVRFGADELVDRQQLSVAEFWAGAPPRLTCPRRPHRPREPSNPRSTTCWPRGRTEWSA